MSMNIKNDEAHKLALELVALTGESLTAAVTEALRERLERVQNTKSKSLSERLMAIGRDVESRLAREHRTIDHAELLYGDDGLPQ